MKRVWKKGFVWLLIAAMLIGVFSVSAATGLLRTLTNQTTTEEDEEVIAVVKNMNLRTQSGEIAGITDPMKPTGRQSEWSGSKVYFGSYNGDSILFRVLDSVTSDYATDSTKSMLLDSEAVLVRKQFDETAGANVWADSSLRAWMNNNAEGGFLYGFSALEQSVLIASTRTNAEGLGVGIEDLEWISLDGDKVFALDAKEVTNPAYGFSDTDFSAANRVKKIGTTATYWWLRSSSQANAGTVYADGNVFYANTDAKFVGVSPAMNIDTSKVLFATAVWNYGKNSVDKTATVAEVGTDHVEDNTWKMTLIDETKKIDVNGAAQIEGTTVTIPYTYSGSDVSQLSVMITSDNYTSDNAEVLYYGKLSVNDTEFASGTGTGTFTLPENIKETYPNYKMYLMAEDVNGNSMTDYVSEPMQIAIASGDANGDGSVNVKDLVRVKRYLFDRTVVIASGADIDGKNGVTVDDLVLLRKKLVEQ